jgi:phospholipid/cholesterol/gamma-HCH transport system substrate-binding protein
METRAHHVAVGAFVLLLLVGAAAFVIWISKFQGQTEFAYYDILTEDDVTGLQVDGPVRYHGVTVGRVAEIRIDPDNPTLVRITVEVVKGTPIHIDAVATLEPQGITGVLYVLLKGGLQGSAMMVEAGKPPYPIIRAERGKVAAILASAPELLDAAKQLIARVELLFDEDNRQAIAGTLKNLQALTDALAENREGLTHLVQSGAAAADEIQSLAAELHRQLGTITDTTKLAQQDLHNVSTSFSDAAKQISELVADNRRPINDFTSTGLYEASQLVTELRLFVDTMNHIAVQFERDPARFLFGDRQKGFEAQ